MALKNKLIQCRHAVWKLVREASQTCGDTRLFCRLGSWPGQLKNVNWLRTAATQTLLEISVLGPAKSIMHNMNYMSFYLSKQLLFELNSLYTF